MVYSGGHTVNTPKFWILQAVKGPHVFQIRATADGASTYTSASVTVNLICGPTASVSMGYYNRE